MIYARAAGLLAPRTLLHSYALDYTLLTYNLVIVHYHKNYIQQNILEVKSLTELHLTHSVL